MGSPFSVPLLDHFAALSDPRQHAKVPVSVTGNPASGFGRDARWSGTTFVETTLWGPSIWRSSSGFTATTAASRATIRCVMCSRRWTQSCSRPAFWPGWQTS